MVSSILREWLVMVPLMLHQFASGIVLAYPAVLTPALINGTGDIRATRDEASWIAASFSMTGSFGFLFLPSLMQIYGRKFINITINLILIIGWLEMRKLILAQQEMKRVRKFREQSFIARLLTSLRSAALMKPFRVLFFAILLAHICGRHFLQAEVTQIMVSLTGDRSKAYYYTIAFDCMKILALVTSSYFVRKFKRRTLLFCTGYSACFLLGSFCLVDLFVSKQVISIKWLTPLLLILFNVVCYIGIIPLTMVLKGELFPLEYKGMGVTLVGITSAICSMVLLKSTSKLLDLIEPHGTFAVYLFIALCCLLCLQYILPETKDRTLQDIELEFTDIKIRNGDNGGEFTGELVKTDILKHDVLASKSCS